MDKCLNKIGLKFSKWGSFLGIGLLICLVLLDTKHEISAQNIYFIFCTGLLLLVSSCTMIFTKARPKLSLIDMLLILLSVWILINYNFVTAVNAEGSFVNLIFIGVSYISLRVIFSVYKNAMPFTIITIALCGLIESVYGIAQLTGLSNSNHMLYRTTGTFFNPGPYGGYLAVVMIVSLDYLIGYSNWVTRYFVKYIKYPRIWLRYPVMIGYPICYGAFIFSFIIFFGIMSRAAILAFAISFFVLFFMKRSIRNKLFKYIKDNRTKALLLFLLMLVVVCAFIYYAYVFKQDSANGRIFMWKIASKIILENPVVGVGLGAYCGKYAETQANYFVSNPNSHFINIAGAPEYGFNEYLQIGAELGLLGMFLFIAILFISVYVLLKRRSGVACGLLSLAVFASFSYPLSLLPFQILTLVFLSYSSSIKCTLVKYKFISLRFLTVLVILFYIYIQYGDIYMKRIIATEEWSQVQSLYRNQEFESAIIEFNKLYPYMHDNPRYLFEYGRALNMIGEFEKSNQVLKEGILLSSDPMFSNIMGNNFKELELFEKAEKSYVFAFNILPDRMYSVYLLMKLYERSRENDKMVDMAKMIMLFNSKVESSATMEMREEAKSVLRSQND